MIDYEDLVCDCLYEVLVLITFHLLISIKSRCGLEL